MASYRAEWDNGIVVEFRDLTWQEFQDLCSQTDPDNIDPTTALEVYKRCCLSGPQVVTAGLGFFVAKHQIVNNPFAGDFKSISAVLQTARNYVSNNYLVAAQALVANTFNYTVEEIKGWPAEKLFVRIAQAEVIVGNKLNPSNPEAAPQEQIQAKRLTPKALAEKRILERKQKG